VSGVSVGTCTEPNPHAARGPARTAVPPRRRHVQQAPEQGEPGVGVIAEPLQHVAHDRVDGVEEKVVVGEVVHTPSLPQRVACVLRICGGNVQK